MGRHLTHSKKQRWSPGSRHLHKWRGGGSPQGGRSEDRAGATAPHPALRDRGSASGRGPSPTGEGSFAGSVVCGATPSPGPSPRAVSAVQWGELSYDIPPVIQPPRHWVERGKEAARPGGGEVESPRPPGREGVRCFFRPGRIPHRLRRKKNRNYDRRYPAACDGVIHSRYVVEIFSLSGVKRVCSLARYRGGAPARRKQFTSVCKLFRNLLVVPPPCRAGGSAVLPSLPRPLRLLPPGPDPRRRRP